MAKPIADTDLIELSVGRWMPTDVAFVRDLFFSGTREAPDGSVNAPTVELLVLIQPRPSQSTGWPDPKGPFWEARIRFNGVREFRVDQRGAGDLQVAGFNIEDHSKSQMEDARLRVFDYESDSIGFWAVSAQVLSCECCAIGPVASPYSREYPGDFSE